VRELRHASSLLLPEVFGADVIRGEQTQAGSAFGSSFNGGPPVGIIAFDDAKGGADLDRPAAIEAPGFPANLGAT